MRGTIGLVVSVVLAAVSLAGLGVSLHEMMAHADPNGALISLGGLAVFVVGSMATLLLAAR